MSIRSADGGDVQQRPHRRPRRTTPLADAVALIDALWDDGRRLFNIEQIALSEAFRLHGLADRRDGAGVPALLPPQPETLHALAHRRLDAARAGIRADAAVHIASPQRGARLQPRQSARGRY